jgi:hypothetical protein
VIGAVVLDWNGSAWAEEPTPWTTAPASGIGAPSALACPSAGLCLVVNGSGYALRSGAGTWTPEQVIDPHGGLDALSCPTATFCVAADDDGFALQWDGSSWSAPVRVVPTATQYPGIGTVVSCPSTQFCMVMNSDGDYATYAAGGLP